MRMTLSKTDRILALINFYLPHSCVDQYRYEADSIAYNTRKNSSLKTIEKLIKEYLGEYLDELYNLDVEEKSDKNAGDQLVHQIAVGIKEVL